MRGLARWAFLGFVAIVTGCGAGGLTLSQSALLDDHDTVGDADDDLQVGLEEPLSGAEPADPGAVDPAWGTAGLMTAVSTNPGRFFKPAGCLTTTVSGQTATHVFKGCTGPYGLTTFDGTVTSTWTSGSGVLTVQHAATDFKINGSSVTHAATIQYTKSGSVVTRKRTGTTSGTGRRGVAFSRTFDMTVAWDSAARCVTREGTSSATVGSRDLGMTIAGYKRCGVGLLGCPSSGTITLTRTQPSLTVKIAFPGGARVTITRPDGVEVDRPLICNASAG